MMLTENRNFIGKMLKNLSKLTPKKIITNARQGWKELEQLIIDAGVEDQALSIINKCCKSNYKGLSDVGKKVIVHEGKDIVFEDFSHYMDSMRDTVYNSSLVMGMLEIWIQLSKLLDNEQPNYKRLVFFGILWLILSSAKYYGEWKTWKQSTKDGKSEK